MSGTGATPLFIDTGAFYARADTDDTHHEDAIRLFSGIRTGDTPTGRFTHLRLFSLNLRRWPFTNSVTTLLSKY